MIDNFEKYIIENRSQFNYHEADKNKLWANIESKLNKPKPISKILWLRRSNIVRVAATLIIVLGLFYVVNIMLDNSTGNTQEDNEVEHALVDIDMHYKGLVAIQVKLLDKNPSLSNEQKKEFLSFMDDLDVEYEALKVELQKSLDTELILESIVMNYKKRIELIENLLKQINSSKKIEENEEDEFTL